MVNTFQTLGKVTLIFSKKEREIGFHGMTVLQGISSSHDIHVPYKASLPCVSTCAASVCKLLNRLYCTRGEDTHGLFHLHTLHPPVSHEQNSQKLWVTMFKCGLITGEDICLNYIRHFFITHGCTHLTQNPSIMLTPNFCKTTTDISWFSFQLDC